MEAVLGLLLFMLLILMFAVGYKKRYSIVLWLNDPEVAQEWSRATKRRRLVRRIEDAQDQLRVMDEMDKSGKEE